MKTDGVRARFYFLVAKLLIEEEPLRLLRSLLFNLEDTKMKTAHTRNVLAAALFWAMACATT